MSKVSELNELIDGCTRLAEKAVKTREILKAKVAKLQQSDMRKRSSRESIFTVRPPATDDNPATGL